MTPVSSILKKSTVSVLVIDDERSISIAVTDLLESYGYETHYALNVDAGLEILKRNPLIDIVLLDFELGTGTNGLEAIPLILQKRPHMQIIMLTSHDDVNLGVNCVKAGAFDYLTKPFDEERFFGMVPQAMEKKC